MQVQNCKILTSAEKNQLGFSSKIEMSRLGSAHLGKFQLELTYPISKYAEPKKPR